jgi:hypothetical protein
VSPLPISRLLLLACAAPLGCGTALADPRDIQEIASLTPEQKEALRLEKAADIDAWLRKLEGKFRIEGTFYREGDEVNVARASGLEDCVTIGPGAGMHCVINVVWDEDYGADGQGGQTGVSSLAPAMIQYGYDPVTSRVRYLQVDNQSLAEPNESLLRGNTIATRTHCANTPASQVCERVTRIYIPPDRSYITMTIDMERTYARVSSLQLDLRPMTQEQWDEVVDELKQVQRPSDQEPAPAQSRKPGARSERRRR